MRTSGTSHLSIPVSNDLLEEIIENATALSVSIEDYLASLISRNAKFPLPEYEKQPEDKSSLETNDPINDTFSAFKKFRNKIYAETTENPHPLEEFPTMRLFTEKVDKGMQDFLSEASESEEKRKKIIERILSEGAVRRISPLPDPEVWGDLLEQFPNFNKVTAKIQSLAMIGKLGGGRPVPIPPLLLVGPPGIGKSAYLKKLAHILGVGITFMDCSSQSSASSLAGLSFTFKSGCLGPVAKLLCFGSEANPLFILDEIEKSATGRDHGNILDALHNLLERVTAKDFSDEGLGVEFPIDTSWITWIATANSLDGIPPSLLSRFLVYSIDPPSQGEMARSVIPSIYETLRESLPIKEKLADLSNEIVDSLKTLSPREVRKSLEEGIEKASRRTYFNNGLKSGEKITVIREDIGTRKISERERVGFI